ncbi:tetratricopeptide repeat protein [Silvimonas soli]|uniref:tetratricopeptide repeat protein n=1 Tax=Silvimonas soli TaxID=2980100 RepID=UPI0024B3AC62|nr:tetratricopeptide repeat protein [Silvimonas soli]
MTAPNAVASDTDNAAFTQLVQQAITLHLQGQRESAEAIYLAVLQQQPHPDALHWLGILRHQQGNGAEAVPLLARSCELQPENAEWRNDLGNVLASNDAVVDAAEQFRAALQLDERSAVYWNNFGAMLQRLNHETEAGEAWLQAVTLAPDYIDALDNYGQWLIRQGRDQEGAEFVCRAFVLKPAADQPPMMRGIAFYRLGQISDAAQVYRQWLDADPGNPTAKHLLAACSGENVPTRAGDDYVQTTFDDYAATFDARLKQLGYAIPQALHDTLKQLAPANQQWQVLDAGCGTGWCGTFLRDYANTLVGVDLSAKMLEQAAHRQLYDQLEHAELTGWLRQCAQQFGLVCAADLMIYFGDLTELLGATRQVMTAGGLLVFSAENQTDTHTGIDGFQLLPSGRYGHSEHYLREALAEAGFTVQSIKSQVVRQEFGRPVPGWIVVATRRAH